MRIDKHKKSNKVEIITPQKIQHGAVTSVYVDYNKKILEITAKDGFKFCATGLEFDIVVRAIKREYERTVIKHD